MKLLILTLSGLLFLTSMMHKSDTNEQETPPKAGIEKTQFGTFPDGRVADLFTLRNEKGMVVQVTNYGGYIVSWTAPDKAGKQEEIILNVPTFADYLKGTPSLGPIIGRFGNRIANGKFTIDGQEYTLAQNNNGNHIHGGPTGFDKRLWQAKIIDGKESSLVLGYMAKDGEEGYPGNLAVMVTYTLQNDNALRIDYEATTDKATVINLTNHTYFNLSGLKHDVLNHELMVAANRYLPTDPKQIPTGELKPVNGTPFDFLKPTAIGTHINDTTDTQIRYGKGYDHCWVFTNMSKGLKLGATVYEPTSGRFMEMYTTEPAVQVYTANNLNGKLVNKDGVALSKRFGLCLETEHFPDAPNHPNFPSTVLRPNETYKSTTMYKLSVK
ncbi:galactose-1-epimerase [Spirosoma sp. HMF4905]|uniref:Aldose 1-epimerase n=1 Tax=Spirosoma arboris TaxID=2682092 RepID=A0A7K1S958_9BACT|nr:aldose epimerase family protein [Spirosoma arboris]MVM30364.1 galactose-1-epimerase [Spirosoma arboris]